MTLNTRPTLSRNCFNSSAMLPRLYDLAEHPDFAAKALEMRGKKIGYVYPAERLRGYLETFRNHRASLASAISSPVSFYHSLDKQDSLLKKDGKNLVLIWMGIKKEEIRTLAVVNENLHADLAQSSSPVKQERISDITPDPELPVAFVDQTRDLSQLCEMERAVLVSHSGGKDMRRSYPIAAVPVRIGRILHNALFNMRAGFVEQKTASDVNHHKYDYAAVCEGKKFILVTKGNSKMRDSWQPSFMLVPSWLLQYLEIDEGGLVAGVRLNQPVRVSFPANITPSVSMKKNIHFSFTTPNDERSFAQRTLNIVRRYGPDINWQNVSINGYAFTASKQKRSYAHDRVHKVLFNTPGEVSYALHPDGRITDIGIHYKTNTTDSIATGLAERAIVEFSGEPYFLSPGVS